MSDSKSDRLLFEPYWTPPCRGEEVRVGGLTDAPIPWPSLRRKGPHSLILCSDLVRAVKRNRLAPWPITGVSALPRFTSGGKPWMCPSGRSGPRA
jgi:hypothetical protein